MSSTAKQINPSTENSGFKWWRYQWQSAVLSFHRLWLTPVASTMTIAVLGIVLALPMGLFILLKNVDMVSQQWNNGVQIAVYFKADAPQDAVSSVLSKLQVSPQIKKLNYISPNQGLAQFEQQSGINDVMGVLTKNPLPAVAVIWPTVDNQSPQALQMMVKELKLLPNVASVQLNMRWVKRLHAMLELGNSIVFIFGILLAIATLLIIGNTIRLATQNRRQEIEVIKLIGGSDRFARRPFLYAGIWYGVFGALLAWLTVSYTIWWLQTPVATLARQYGSDFLLQQFSLQTLGWLLIAGVLLGLCGAWLAVTRELKRIQPT